MKLYHLFVRLLDRIHLYLKGMKMRFKLFILLITISSVFFLAFTQKENQKSHEENKVETFETIVEEVIQTNKYTYLNVNEKDQKYWVAVSKREIAKGDTFCFDNKLEMKDFKSRSLQRTFETIYFVQDKNKQSLPQPKVNMNIHHNKKKLKVKKNISIEPIEGGITIAELFSNKKSYANNVIKIKGEVIKFNSGIMGKNWIHLQDGSNDSDNYDLTITTNDTVSVGDIVAFVGKITLNRLYFLSFLS